MIKVTLKHWQAVGVAATLSLTGCGDESGVGGQAGESDREGSEGNGETAITAPAIPAGEGGEAGEAGAASAYAGVAGDQLTALRLQHLKGFLMAAGRVADSNLPMEASVLVQQGLLEVYDGAPDQFGSLNVELVRAAGETGLSSSQIKTRLRAAETEIDRVSGELDIDHPALTARMVDIATGLYQHVNQTDYVDPIEYQHSMGAALAARDTFEDGASHLRHENRASYNAARAELTRFVAFWESSAAPERPAAYRDVLAQGSRVRLALSPLL